MPDLAQLFHAWCAEGVKEFGDDWSQIHAYVAKKMAELSPEERAELLEQLDSAFGPKADRPRSSKN